MSPAAEAARERRQRERERAEQRERLEREQNPPMQADRPVQAQKETGEPLSMDTVERPAHERTAEVGASLSLQGAMVRLSLRTLKIDSAAAVPAPEALQQRPPLPAPPLAQLPQQPGAPPPPPALPVQPGDPAEKAAIDAAQKAAMLAAMMKVSSKLSAQFANGLVQPAAEPAGSPTSTADATPSLAPEANVHMAPVLIRDVDFNDCQKKGVKALLTKKETHDDIAEKTGVTVTLRGKFLLPGDMSGERGLHLRLEGEQAALEEAIRIIHEHMGVETESATPAASEEPPGGVGMGLAPLGSMGLAPLGLGAPGPPAAPPTPAAPPAAATALNATATAAAAAAAAAALGLGAGKLPQLPQPPSTAAAHGGMGLAPLGQAMDATASTGSAAVLRAMNGSGGAAASSASSRSGAAQLTHRVEVRLGAAADDEKVLRSTRGRLLGPGGAYMKHIQERSGAWLQLVGKGSNSKDAAEHVGPLSIKISAANQAALDSATELAKHLISTVIDGTLARFKRSLARRAEA